MSFPVSSGGSVCPLAFWGHPQLICLLPFSRWSVRLPPAPVLVPPSPRGAVQPPAPVNLVQSLKASSTTPQGSSQEHSPVRGARNPPCLGIPCPLISDSAFTTTTPLLPRHSAPQLPGQQWAAPAGHRYHPANSQRPTECHAALPGHAPFPDPAPLPRAVCACLARPGPHPQIYLLREAGRHSGLTEPSPHVQAPR